MYSKVHGEAVGRKYPPTEPISQQPYYQPKSTSQHNPEGMNGSMTGPFVPKAWDKYDLVLHRHLCLPGSLFFQLRNAGQSHVDILADVLSMKFTHEG